MVEIGLYEEAADGKTARPKRPRARAMERA